MTYPVERFGVSFGVSVTGAVGFDFGGNITSSSKPVSIRTITLSKNSLYIFFSDSFCVWPALVPMASP